MRGISVAALVVVSLALSACNITLPRGVTGSGKIVNEARTVSGFRKVDLSGFGDLIIDVNGREALTIETDDNVAPLVESVVRGDTLHIGFKRGASIQRVTRLRYHLSAIQLEGLMVSGAGNVRVDNIDSPRMEVNTSGAGRIHLSGKAVEQVVSLSGAGDVNGENLRGETARVTLSGVGRAIVNASKALNVDISGAGLVEYIGNPQVTQQASGIGSVKQRSP